MRDAVIVSTARTPIGRAYRGAFNNLPSPTLAGHAIRAAVERAGIDGAEVQDVVFGAALQQGHQAGNIARTSLLRAGLPVSVAGMSVDRQCASGLMAIATAAKEIIDLLDEASVYKPTLKKVFAINRKIANTAIGRDVVDALSAYPLPVLKQALCQRVPFAESATQGLTVYELDPDMLASREMNDMADEVLEMLA